MFDSLLDDEDLQDVYGEFGLPKHRLAESVEFFPVFLSIRNPMFRPKLSSNAFVSNVHISICQSSLLQQKQQKIAMIKSRTHDLSTLLNKMLDCNACVNQLHLLHPVPLLGTFRWTAWV